LVSAAEPFRGNDPANVLFRQIIGAFAQFEKSGIAERMSDGRRQKTARGGYSGGGAPTGYRARRGGKALEVDPEAARLVLHVFALRDLEPVATLQVLADHLNAEGFTGPKGGRLFAMQVKRILDRRAFYEGTYHYAGIEAEGQHAALLGKAASEARRRSGWRSRPKPCGGWATRNKALCRFPGRPSRSRAKGARVAGI
jgi:hypothetical protein